jgi:hypothetical protein
VNPGDRAADCGGAMKPINVEEKGGKHIVYYKCQKCDYKFKVKASSADNVDKIIEISAKIC